jgi:hypothetical protein
LAADGADIRSHRRVPKQIEANVLHGVGYSPDGGSGPEPEDADIKKSGSQAPSVSGPAGKQEGQMSASTRTAQQPLGIGQLGAALVFVALILIVAVAIAFGTLGAVKPGVAPAPAVGAPPAVIDHGWSQAGTPSIVGAPPAGYDHGSSAGSMVKPVTGGGYVGDQGLAPRTNDGASVGDDGRKGEPFLPARDPARAGSNGQLRPQ